MAESPARPDAAPAGGSDADRAAGGAYVPQVDITVLGGFHVVVDGSPVRAEEWARRSASALVKLLALAPGRRLHREQVLDALWPDADVEAAAPRLHKAAHFAR